MDAGALSRLKHSLLTGIRTAEAQHAAPQLTQPDSAKPKAQLTDYRIGGNGRTEG